MTDTTMVLLFCGFIAGFMTLIHVVPTPRYKKGKK